MPRPCCVIHDVLSLLLFCFAHQTALVPVHRNLSWVYRLSAFAIWLFTTTIMILDRFYWNVWPRQTFCTDGCGNDFFCDMDEVTASSAVLSSLSYNYNTGEVVVVIACMDIKSLCLVFLFSFPECIYHHTTH